MECYALSMSVKGGKTQIPAELIGYFSEDHFKEYPKVKIPQSFSDDRGVIINLADGNLSDVALIDSNEKAIRANHYHKQDWHLCFLLEGEFEYSWFKIGETMISRTIVKAGEMIFTPRMTAHRFVFLSKSRLITISKLSRISNRYDEDTIKVKDFTDDK